MEEPQRAHPRTVTTTTSSFAENFSTSSSSFAYDREFLRTVPGLLIVAEIVSAYPAGRGEAGARRDPRACSWVRSQLTSADVLQRNPICSASPFFPKCQTQSTSLNEVQTRWDLWGKRVVTLGMSVRGETQLAGGPVRGRGVS